MLVEYNKQAVWRHGSAAADSEKDFEKKSKKYLTNRSESGIMQKLLTEHEASESAEKDFERN